MCKVCLKKWHKGTGRSSGFSTMFEGWSDEKKDTYEIDKGKYDHTNVSGIPAILFNQYCNHSMPSFEIIHLWDKGSSYLVSSRRDSLKIGRGWRV